LPDGGWYDALRPSGDPFERGVEVIPRLFRHLLWFTFLDDLSSFIQRAEFVGLWLSVLELCANERAASVAKFVEE
jgi:hypothetical protein